MQNKYFWMHHAINFHVLVADCVCGVAGTSFLVGVGTSFLVVVGQHEDSWVGSILRHIGWTETHYTKTHVEDSAYNMKLPESRRTLSPLVISRLYMICNPRPLVCYTSLGASSSIVYTHAQCLVFTCTLYTPLSLIYSTRSRLFLQLQGSDPN
jgi:hypothetical protein